MTQNEYLNICLKNDKYYKNYSWYVATMQLPIKQYDENEYFKIIDGRYYVKVNGSEFLLDGVTYERPIFMVDDVYEVTEKEVANLKGKIITTLGRILANKILLDIPFKDKIEFINDKMDIGDIDSVVGRYMQKDIITIDEYLKYSNMCLFMSKFSKIVTVSATPKSLLPPAGIDEYKKKVKKEFVEKYGEDWHTNKTYVIMYEDKLREYDDEWLKDDPANGVLNSGKVKNNARKRMYLVFGAENGFDKNRPDALLVDESLMDGYPKDKEKLANMFNNSRAGSMDRGGETQKGGLLAKILLRATSSIIITKNDCQTKVGKIVSINKRNHTSFYNRYMIVNGESVLIEDTEKLIGKTIEVRSPQYCHEENGNICRVCAGETLAKYDKGISLLVTDISSIVLYISMKAFHNTTMKTVDLDIRDIIF